MWLKYGKKVFSVTLVHTSFLLNYELGKRHITIITNEYAILLPSVYICSASCAHYQPCLLPLTNRMTP